MENLILSPSNYTPEVNFDYRTGILEIIGTATPEDSYTFFQPLINWFDAYRLDPAPYTQLIFKMEYFNTSSTVFMLRLMKGVARLGQEGKMISIKWFHKDDDDDSMEAGRDFSILAKTPIEIISVQGY